MRIKYSKKFQKRFKKLPQSLKNKVVLAIEKFEKNPHDLALKNHPLKGKLESRRAFSVTGDIRIIFEEYDNYIVVLMLNLGTHTQVYD
ncbi:MAG: type II toxin-antitoxin system mRNA interferase toxin, RelE/StbE family [Patescibacteria group bacterium]